nr:MAG TPA: hypothetical protein [Caudoviricetes sp.]
MSCFRSFFKTSVFSLHNIICAIYCQYYMCIIHTTQ